MKKIILLSAFVLPLGQGFAQQQKAMPAQQNNVVSEQQKKTAATSENKNGLITIAGDPHPQQNLQQKENPVQNDNKQIKEETKKQSSEGAKPAPVNTDEEKILPEEENIRGKAVRQPSKSPLPAPLTPQPCSVVIPPDANVIYMGVPDGMFKQLPNPNGGNTNKTDPPAPLAATVVMSEYFDSYAGYNTNGTVPPAPWSRNPNAACNSATWGNDYLNNWYAPPTAPNCMWCNGKCYNSSTNYYNANMNTWLIYGPFDLTGTTDADLDFMKLYDAETNYDYCQWLASRDGVTYNGSQVTGTNTSWVATNFDLTTVPVDGNLCGDASVWIAFRFTSDGSVQWDGYFIDNVVLTTTSCAAPAAPTANAASGITSSSFNANWNAVGGATTYYLDVNTNNTFTGTWILNNFNVGNVVTYPVTGLTCNTNYYYRVRSSNACGTSASSNVITVTTTNPGAPAAPVATAATNVSSSSFSSNWTASAGATTYYLDVNTNNTFTGTWILNNFNVGNVTTYPVTGLTPSTTYYYRVRAANACGTSGNSGTITVTTIACTGGVFLHPTVGIASEYVGSCEVATCSGTYYDNGGAAGNYSDNIGFDGCWPFWCPLGIYRIFCPNSVGQCLTATFSSFDTESGWDEMTITNGSTQNSPVLWQGSGAGAIGPFTGTINGCLGFRFASDGSGTRPGWAATFSSAACAGGPNGTDNNDCLRLTQLCASAAVAANSTGPGTVAEACGGGGCPAGGENYSNWFSVSFNTAGTWNFTIVPTVGADDYDYAVYGPVAGGSACSSLGAAIRCSDAALTGNTGIGNGAVDASEDVTGDKWTAQMNVLAGDIYFIMIDEWTPTGAGYNLNFGGTAVMSCVPIPFPVEFLSFDAKYDAENRAVNLSWSTATETNNDYFAVERSTDGNVFEQIALVKGAAGGNSSTQLSYTSVDADPYPGEINYYRLRQVDFNGAFDYSNVAAVAINDPISQFSVYPNPSDETANIAFNIAYENDCVLNIYDCTARRMLSYRFISVKGKNVIPLDLTSFHKGVYFVTLSDKVDMLKTSFVKE